MIEAENKIRGINIKVIKVKAKRAFTRTRIPGEDYVINQYVGYQHACRYCYANKENLPELVSAWKFGNG